MYTVLKDAGDLVWFDQTDLDRIILVIGDVPQVMFPLD